MKTSETVVLIPHYNNLEGLYKSLESISDAEPVDVLIVDDGSKIRPEKSYLEYTFPQVCNFFVHCLEKNMGIEHALNAGLQFIIDLNSHLYVARLDCSDICDSKRFAIQKNYLQENKDIYLVGSYVTVVDKNNEFIFQFTVPLTAEKIKRNHYYMDPFVHPAIMFKTVALQKTGHYPVNYIYCEDTAFFHNFIRHYKTANIPLPLVSIYMDPNGISQSKYRKQKLSRIKFSFDTFTFRYFFSWSTGLAKNIVCFVLGNKIPTKIAIYLGRKK